MDQSANKLALVEPSNFNFNTETFDTNVFQNDVQFNKLKIFEEFENLMKMLGYNMSDEELSAIFNAVDEEGEGEILFHDFLTLMVVLMENDTEELNLINAFETIDEKNSGLISVEHVRNILTTIGEQMTTKEIEKFIENTDLDNDGMVSINDIQRMLA